MRKFYSAICFLFFITFTNAQQLGQVTFSGGSNLSYFSFFTNDNALIRVSDDGKITEWGIELQSNRSNNYFNPKLQPYIGRVEYYGPEADSAYSGKLKSIGTCILTYYNHYENSTKVGKLKTVGTVSLDYYDEFEKSVLKGKLRFIGSLVLEYYPEIGDAAYKNKMKAIGNTAITYYSSFDDKQLKGKIKSIGSVPYTWYTSFDLNRSGLKTGSYRTNINGVTYILQ